MPSCWDIKIGNNSVCNNRQPGSDPGATPVRCVLHSDIMWRHLIVFGLKLSLNYFKQIRDLTVLIFAWEKKTYRDPSQPGSSGKVACTVYHPT